MAFPSEEQKRAIESIIENLTVKKTNTAFCGPAGSGKSSTVGEVITRLLELHINVALTALTNRAARSLEEAILESTGMHREVRTIHSFLKLKPCPGGLRKRGNKGEKEESFTGIIIIDESSMLDGVGEFENGVGKLRHHIERFQKTSPNAVFLFVGDVHQLPPIGEAIAYCYADNSGIPLIELTEVWRQEGANPICWVANTFRLAQDGETLPRLKTETNDKGEGVIEISRAEYDQAAIDSNGRAMFLSYTNRGAIYYDKLVRNAISQTNRHVAEGEQLVANEPFLIGDEILIGNCEEVTVVDVSYGKTMYGIPYTSVDVKTEEGNLVTTMLPEDEMFKRSMIDARWKESFKLRKMNRDGDADLLTREAKSISILFSDLRYGYGQTCHKSQGQSIDIVFIDLDNISMMRDDMDMLKSLYVAFSRGRKRVYFTGKLPERLYKEK